ncbi:uncharacterized protein LOC127797106 [Diospyros lotus]|uniref:uncharacterized protein LOC127797106 n=1 Tax=Diospyros lotus TaxID=55363 RepID=UPI002257923B|nr:uncharacterized protein LOC127797106 [Diospyros lotus]
MFFRTLQFTVSIFAPFSALSLSLSRLLARSLSIEVVLHNSSSESGKMENSAADHLPEAHSLPDGFVESSGEPLPPSTPIPSQEKSSTDYKEEKLVAPNPGTDLVVGEPQSIGGELEKNENSGSFPAVLSGNDGFTAAGEPAKVAGCSVVGECTSVMNQSLHSDSVDVVRKSGELVTGSSCGKPQDQEKPPTSGNAITRGLEMQEDNVKEITSTESAGNNRKENSEAKRKNTKRMLKSEKEFLEFTLKYQQVIAERDAAITVRDKLESLCRELQRQNKMLMDECKRVSTEGQNLRLDLSNKFQDAIKEVSYKLEEQKDECMSQLKENEMLRNQLKEVLEKYADSEEQNAKKLAQKSEQLHIAEFKIRQYEETLRQEQSVMMQHEQQVSRLQETEKNLRLQLAADAEKFQHFQDALVKSNEVFQTFRQEIDKMGKSMKELKKENSFLKSKCEKSDVTLIELVEERERLKKQLEKSKNQKERLESLCRSLQAERKQNLSGGSNSSSAAA